MRYSSTLVIILACSVLSCYPTYNWRLVQTEQFGWEALFPAKPKRNSRKIIIQDHPKQAVIKIDRYSVALNQMDFILDVISFEGEMPDNVSSLQEYVNKMLKTNLNIPPEVNLVDGVLIEGFIGKGESKPVAMILKHLNNDYSMVRGVAVGSPHNFKSDKAEFFLTPLINLNFLGRIFFQIFFSKVSTGFITVCSILVQFLLPKRVRYFYCFFFIF